ncbi:MAG: PTS system mannose/fructose/sorbose family transporter subunit IID [Candidatus Odinarchaeota archaeon]|nr:PTS system mannose/fructose/sorbose family transporter subunit IID [Candidatus Odinarchaeota archaeon]
MQAVVFSPLQVVLLTIWAMICYSDFRIFRLQLSRPLLSAIGTGLILGDPTTGAVVGATMGLIWLGVVEVGGSLPPDAVLAGVAGSAIAISLGGTPEAVATTLALILPVSVLAAQNWINVGYTFSIFMNHLGDKYAEKGDTRMMTIVHLGTIPIYALICAWPTALLLIVGPYAANAFVEAIPTWLLNGIVVGSWSAVFVGLGILLSLSYKPELMGFFALGFVLAAYLHVPLLGIALFTLGMVSLVVYLRGGIGVTETDGGEESAETGGRVEKKITSKDLWVTYWRSWMLMASINLERWQALGYCWSLIPIFKKFYGDDPERFKEALKVHLQFFNTQPHMAGIILGLNLSLIEAGADLETQHNLKVALMGPFAGIGDSLIWGTIRTIFEALAISFAINGDWLTATLVFLVPWSIFSFGFYWYALVYSYKLGSDFVSKLTGETLKHISEYAGMVALAVVGALTATFFPIKTPLTFESAGITVSLQSLLDGILPSMIPLLLTLSTFSLIRKGYSLLKSFGIMFLATATLGALGILAA